LFKQAFDWLFSLIVVRYERCAEKLAYKRQKEKDKENELSGEKEIELKDSDKRKRYFQFFSTPIMFFYPIFFNFAFQTAENMRKMMIPRRTRTRNIEERKKVSMIVDTFLCGYEL
jgi:hypothetical protein